MDTADLNTRILQLRTLGKKLPFLQKFSRISQSTFHKSPLVRGVFFLAIGLILARSSSESIESQAISDWKRAHPPSVKIWDLVLRTKGLRLLPPDSLPERIARTLPLRMDEESSSNEVWLSQDLRFALVMEESGKIFAYTSSRPEEKLRTKDLPKSNQWTRWDSSLEALEKIILQSVLRSPQLKIQKKNHEWVDPRAIHY